MKHLPTRSLAQAGQIQPAISIIPASRLAGILLGVTDGVADLATSRGGCRSDSDLSKRLTAKYSALVAFFRDEVHGIIAEFVRLIEQGLSCPKCVYYIGW